MCEIFNSLKKTYFNLFPTLVMLLISACNNDSNKLTAHQFDQANKNNQQLQNTQQKLLSYKGFWKEPILGHILMISSNLLNRNEADQNTHEPSNNSNINYRLKLNDENSKNDSIQGKINWENDENKNENDDSNNNLNNTERTINSSKKESSRKARKTSSKFRHKKNYLTLIIPHLWLQDKKILVSPLHEITLYPVNGSSTQFEGKFAFNSIDSEEREASVHLEFTDGKTLKVKSKLTQSESLSDPEVTENYEKLRSTVGQIEFKKNISSNLRNFISQALYKENDNECFQESLTDYIENQNSQCALEIISSVDYLKKKFTQNEINTLYGKAIKNSNLLIEERLRPLVNISQLKYSLIFNWIQSSLNNKPANLLLLSESNPVPPNFDQEDVLNNLFKYILFERQLISKKSNMDTPQKFDENIKLVIKKLIRGHFNKPAISLLNHYPELAQSNSVFFLLDYFKTQTKQKNTNYSKNPLSTEFRIFKVDGDLLKVLVSNIVETKSQASTEVISEEFAHSVVFNSDLETIKYLNNEISFLKDHKITMTNKIQQTLSDQKLFPITSSNFTSSSEFSLSSEISDSDRNEFLVENYEWIKNLPQDH